MILRQLRGLGLTSDVLNALGFASVAASIAVWSLAKRGDAGHGERFGIFVGLWAPTFFVLGTSMAKTEQDRDQ